MMMTPDSILDYSETGDCRDTYVSPSHDNLPSGYEIKQVLGAKMNPIFSMYNGIVRHRRFNLIY